MKAIAVLLLIIFIVDGQSTYSIDAFLDFLQENGYYEIILQVKMTFGDDIAIDVCKQLVQTNDCEIVVRTYMTSSHSMNCPSPQHNYIEITNHIEALVNPEKTREIRKECLLFFHLRGKAL